MKNKSNRQALENQRKQTAPMLDILADHQVEASDIGLIMSILMTHKMTRNLEKIEP